MDNNEGCKIQNCGKTHGCTIIGIIFLVIATILTLITFSGFGILGMFLVGVAFLCHKHMSGKMCNCDCHEKHLSTDDTVIPVNTTTKKPL